MAFTCRLKPDLETEAKEFAAAVGISLQALVSLSVRDYLDRRTNRFGRPLKKRPASMVVDLAGKDEQGRHEALSAVKDAPLAVTSPWTSSERVNVRPPKSRADPCPCGAKNSLGQPVKYKHCHGKAVGQ